MKTVITAAAIAVGAFGLAACGTPPTTGASSSAPVVSPAQAASDNLGTAWDLAKVVASGYVATCTLAPNFGACQVVVVDIARKALMVGDTDVAAAQTAILAAGSDTTALQKAVAIGKQAISAFENTVIGLGLGASSSTSFSMPAASLPAARAAQSSAQSPLVDFQKWPLFDPHLLPMPKPARFWTCTACGETVVNEPMLVLKHQMAHARRRPFAGMRSTPERQEEREGGKSET